MHIQYSMNIPDFYLNFIEGLRKEFGITLQVREKHILALYPEWSTRGVIYAPDSIILEAIKGPVKQQVLFNTPFSNNGFYVLENTMNNTIKEVIIPFSIR